MPTPDTPILFKKVCKIVLQVLSQILAVPIENINIFEENKIYFKLLIPGIDPKTVANFFLNKF